MLLFILALHLQQPALVRCSFHPAAAKQWTGGCGRLFNQTPRMTLSRVSKVTSGRWRADAEADDAWTGTMTDAGYPDALLELESFRARTGVAGILRTEYGWYSLVHYHDADDSLVFEIDTSRTTPPSDLDRAILRRADSLLTEANWNRADDRNCPDGAKALSIYCAMQRAGIEETGGAHHRRPAMELVREIVDERAANRNYSHRLMDYNNDRSTTIADVRSLFAEALRRMDGAATAQQALPATSAGPAPLDSAGAALQLRIIDRARALIGAAKTWNKQETQTCTPRPKTYGLYCALRVAVEEVTGQDDDANPVMRDARAVVDFVASKQYPARLVNYNNDPATSYEDLQAVFRILRNRVSRRKKD
jgi:hypothetical protein